jgi:hypothetical protein
MLLSVNGIAMDQLPPAYKSKEIHGGSLDFREIFLSINQ